MGVEVLGREFDNEELATAAQAIVEHCLVYSERDMEDYLDCIERWGYEPETPAELVGFILDDALSTYHRCNYDKPIKPGDWSTINYAKGYPTKEDAYYDVGESMLADTSLMQALDDFKLKELFDFETVAERAYTNEYIAIGSFGYAYERPYDDLEFSSKQIYELANYLSGKAYDSAAVNEVFHKVSYTNFNVNDAQEFPPKGYDFEVSPKHIKAYEKAPSDELMLTPAPDVPATKTEDLSL